MKRQILGFVIAAQLLISVTAFGVPNDPVVLGTAPTSPANNNSPSVSGTSDPNNDVYLYADSSCTTPLWLSTANGSGDWSTSVAVSNDTSTTFYAKAFDGVDYSSCSSTSATYVEDSTAPTQPSSLSVEPASPANNNSPTIFGATSADDLVYIYTNSTCTSSVAGTSTANGSGFFAIGVSVVNDSATTFYARAEDLAGNSSACSSSNVSYIEDSTAPAAPTSLATSPTSPANNNSPNVTGSAEANSYVYLYTNSSCTSSVAGTGAANGSGAFSIVVSVANDSTTTFYARTMDAASNASGCSTSNVTYVEDSSAPNVPTALNSTPTSPANNNTPNIGGTADANIGVYVYTNSTCTSAVAGTGMSNGSGEFSISVSVSDNTTTTFYAKAVDGASNESACSTSSVTYVEDSNAPGATLVTGVTPTSPANNNNPTVLGAAETNATVKLYTNSACSSSIVGTGSATSGSFSILVAVIDNSTTTFWATATDAAGNVSSCSATSATFIEDSSAPTMPTVSAVTPTSPGNDNNPFFSGTTEIGSTVKLYTNSSCTSAVLAHGTPSVDGTFSLMATVSSNSTTTVWGTATDASSNVSACSSTSVTYVEDSTPPFAPNLSSVSPTSPSDDNTPTISGTAENNATVKLYSDSSCSTLAATTSANGSGNFSASPTVSDDESVTYYGTATDAAGNASSCSGSSVAYTNYGIAEGVGYFQGTRTVSSTNLNQTTASPFQWSSGQFHSTYFSHSTASNSHQVTVKVAGTYLFHLSMRVTHAANASSQAITFSARTNGTDASDGTCYAITGNYNAAKTGTCNLSLRLNLAANDVVDITAVRGRGTSTITSPGSALFVEYIDSSRPIFYGFGTTNTNSSSTNFNANSTEYQIRWAEVQKDSGYTHSDVTNPQNIQLADSGTYFVFFNVPMTATTNYVNQRFKLYGGVSGTSFVTGAEAKQGYSGGFTSAHVGSTHWSGLVHSASANDILKLGQQREARTSGNQTVTSGKQASIYVEKIDTSGAYFGRGVTTTGATSTNYNQSAYLRFTTDDLMDSSTYTHSTSTNPHQITVDEAGYYKVTVSGAFTSATADTNPQFTLNLNGVAYDQAVACSSEIENTSNHSESSSSLVYYVKAAANDILTVATTQTQASGNVTSSTDHTITIRKIATSATP